MPKYKYSYNFMSNKFCDRKGTWIIVSTPNYIHKYYCKNYHVEKLLGAFRYCCLFCISPRLYNSSIMLLASVKVLVWPDKFSSGKISSLV